MTTTASTDRAAYISGLRKLADWLEANPNIRLPYTNHFTMGFWQDARATLAAAARAFPGPLDKKVDQNYFDLVGRLDGITVELTAYREDVCVRKVIGTHEVEVEERQGADTRPVVKRTETVELVEWECPPLLAEAAEAVSA